MSMELLLRGLAEKMVEEERAKPKPLPEAIVMELREAAKRYSRDNPYAVGDLITPATGSYYNCKGEPHLVIATCAAEYRWDAKNGSPHYGIRVDTRVLQIVDGSMAAFWIESAQFDQWPEPASKAASLTLNINGGTVTSLTDAEQLEALQRSRLWSIAPSSIADTSASAPASEPVLTAPEAAAPALNEDGAFQMIADLDHMPQPVAEPAAPPAPTSEPSNG